jgi:phosphohistidine phosphatase
MKTLLVLRHAKASHDDSAISDHERPLTKKGRKAAKQMGKLARDQALLPDVVLSSTAERARSTADVFVEASGHTDAVVYLDELYLAEPPAYLEALRRHGANASRVLVVGHNPGLEALVFRLTGQTEHLPTAALVECSLPIADWSELGPETMGTLGKVFRPKELD